MLQTDAQINIGKSQVAHGKICLPGPSKSDED